MNPLLTKNRLMKPALVSHLFQLVLCVLIQSGMYTSQPVLRPLQRLVQSLRLHCHRLQRWA